MCAVSTGCLLKLNFKKEPITIISVTAAPSSQGQCKLSGQESTCQCNRCRSDPWVGRFPWRRKWQPTAVSLSGKSLGQRSLAGYSPWSHKRDRYDLVTKQQQCKLMHQTFGQQNLGRSYCPHDIHHAMKSDNHLGQTRLRRESESGSHSVVSDSVTPWTIESMEFSRPEYWSE